MHHDDTMEGMLNAALRRLEGAVSATRTLREGLIGVTDEVDPPSTGPGEESVPDGSLLGLAGRILCVAEALEGRSLANLRVVYPGSRLPPTPKSDR